MPNQHHCRLSVWDHHHTFYSTIHCQACPLSNTVHVSLLRVFLCGVSKELWQLSNNPAYVWPGACHGIYQAAHYFTVSPRINRDFITQVSCSEGVGFGLQSDISNLSSTLLMYLFWFIFTKPPFCSKWITKKYESLLRSIIWNLSFNILLASDINIMLLAAIITSST